LNENWFKLVLELAINNIFTKLNHYKLVLIFDKFKFKKLVIALRPGKAWCILNTIVFIIIHIIKVFSNNNVKCLINRSL